MKKIGVLVFFTILCIQAYTQDEMVLISGISDQFSLELAKEFDIKRTDISGVVKGKEQVKIQIIKIYNSDGQQTELSKKFGSNISSSLQKYLNSVRYKKIKYLVHSPFDYTLQTGTKINSTKKNDFTLSGQYILKKDYVFFTKFKLKSINSSDEFIFKDITVKHNNFSILKKNDSLLLEPNFLDQFMDLEKENILVKNIELTQKKSIVPSLVIDGIGQVYETKFDTDYNFKIELFHDAYIYAFFYDPEDKEHPFMWYIANPNIKFKAGTYENFLSDEFNFYETPQSNKYNNIKFVFSETKIDIDKFLTKKFIDGYETTLLENDNCNKLFNLLVSKKNIQTKTIILTF